MQLAGGVDADDLVQVRERLDRLHRGISRHNVTGNRADARPRIFDPCLGRLDRLLRQANQQAGGLLRPGLPRTLPMPSDQAASLTGQLRAESGVGHAYRPTLLHAQENATFLERSASIRLVVLLGTVAIGKLAQVVTAFTCRRKKPGLIIDARGKELNIQPRPELPGGTVLIFAKDGSSKTIEVCKGDIDLDKTIQALLEGATAGAV